MCTPAFHNTPSSVHSVVMAEGTILPVMYSCLQCQLHVRLTDVYSGQDLGPAQGALMTGK